MSHTHAAPPADAAHSHVFLGARHEENTRRTVWVVILTAVWTAMGSVDADQTRRYIPVTAPALAPSARRG